MTRWLPCRRAAAKGQVCYGFGLIKNGARKDGLHLGRLVMRDRMSYERPSSEGRSDVLHVEDSATFLSRQNAKTRSVFV